MNERVNKIVVSDRPVRMFAFTRDSISGADRHLMLAH
jgi:hypothetical protein